MFTRIGPAAFKKDLTNTIALCDMLGHPESQLTCIHVAGTNGKGSTSHMLAAILQEAGYKVGLYTSPHLKDFRERIRINGEMIPEDAVIRFVETYKVQFEAIAPSFFEWTVALCFDWFAHQNVDVAIVETGLGGRLDSTNVIRPIVSVITNIGWDHMDMLGQTLEAIAKEKAGIIKEGIPVVIGKTQVETEQVFRSSAEVQHAAIFFADQLIATRNTRLFEGGLVLTAQTDAAAYDIESDLGGLYQEENIRTVLATVMQLQSQLSITDEHIKNGIKHCKQLTGLLGRWQILGDHPLTICDTGHNADGIQWVVKQLTQHSYRQLHMVIGMVKDKDIGKVLRLLPTGATYYFCQAAIPRAMPADELAAKAAIYGLHGTVCGAVANALQMAQQNAHSDDLIFIGGSTFVVAEVL